ncbi:MAG: hypothetical protein AAF492_15690, partial [Verrucomicrobiota bacterium]
ETELVWDEVVQTTEQLRPLNLANRNESRRAAPTPVLSVKNEARRFLVFDDEFWLDGWAKDDIGIGRIEVNQQLLETEEKARQCYFSQRIPLEVGTNHVVLLCRNLVGRSARLDLEVIRKKPEYLNDQIRMRAGVNDFRTQVEHINTHLLRRQFEHQMREEPVRFHVVNHRQNNVGERNLAASGLTDPRLPMKPDAVLHPDIFFAGQVANYRDGYTFAIHAFERDHQSNERLPPLFTEDVFVPHRNEDLGHSVAGLTLKLEQRFPAAEGRVIKFRALGKVMLDRGTADGLREGLKCVVVLPDPGLKNTRSAYLRRFQGAPIELTIIKAGEDSSLAEVSPRRARSSIVLGDYFYAR